MITVSDILALLKTLREEANRIKNTKITEDLMKLHGFILELSGKNFELLNELHEYKNQIESYKNNEKIENNLIRSKGTIAKYNKQGFEILICTNCWDSDKKIVQVENYESNLCTCPKCGNNSFFGDKGIYAY